MDVNVSCLGYRLSRSRGGVKRSGLSIRQEAKGGAETVGVSLTLLPCPMLFPRELDGWVFVELDVGSEGNADGAQIQEVLHTVISSGSIASYITSPQGFQFRRLGTGKPTLEPGVTSSSFSDSCGSPSVSPPWALLAGLAHC